MRQGKTRAKHLHAVERRQFVFAMRATGMTYQAIYAAARQHFGATLSPSYNTRLVHKDVTIELARLATQLHEDSLQVRELELQRLDAMLHGLYDTAVMGDVPAVLAVLKLMERRAKILGTDAPAKVAPTNPTGTEAYQPAPSPPVAQAYVTPEYITELAQHLAQYGLLNMHTNGHQASTDPEMDGDAL